MHSETLSQCHGVSEPSVAEPPKDDTPAVAPVENSPQPSVVPPDGDPGGTGADDDVKSPDSSRQKEARRSRAFKSSGYQMTDEMREWLRHNRLHFQFYLLHAIFHDLSWRSKILSMPLVSEAFETPGHDLLSVAITNAVKIARSTGMIVPVPPSVAYLKTHLETAARSEGFENWELELAEEVTGQLQDPSYKMHHECIPHYLEAWYGSAHAKRIARKLLQIPIPNLPDILSALKTVTAAAADAACGKENDPYLQVLYSKEPEMLSRSPTGIEGLDRCLNGGWGEGECSILFSGTGAGKSIIAGQCAWHEAAHNGGYPLIISTELMPEEYVARMISCGFSIPISLIQDCRNYLQIQRAIIASPEHSSKALETLKALEVFGDRIHIAKISTDDGLASRAILEREVLRYEMRHGHPPTWVCLDWLGSVADLGGGTSRGSAERAAEWERAANGCVMFAEDYGIPTLVLAQAVNDAQTKRVLTINDIGISKGIGKNMVSVIGLTNAVKRGSSRGKALSSSGVFDESQWLCVCKSRKGEAKNIPVMRDFEYQRFVPLPEGSMTDDAPASPPGDGKGRTIDYAGEAKEVFEGAEALSATDIKKRVCKLAGVGMEAAKSHHRKYKDLGLIEQQPGGTLWKLKASS